MAQDHFRIRTLYGREYQVWSLDNQANLEPVDEVDERFPVQANSLTAD